ncbi:MAG: tetratricopeptide repeat protein [bacterium]
MESLGLNNDVLVGDRKFHVQTNYSESEKIIISNVFNEGQVIESREIYSGDGTSEQEIENKMNELHQELITEMEVLYYIYEKVKTVRHANSSNKLGLLFLRKNLLDEAVEQFNLALEIDPNFSEVYANLGKALIIYESLDEAVNVLCKGADQAPNFADMQNYLGIAYLYKEKFSEAVVHLQKAIELNRNYIGAHYHLGMAILAQAAGSETEDGVVDAATEQTALEHLTIAAEKMIDRHIPNFQKVMNLVNQKSFKEAIDEFLLIRPRDILTHVSNIENEFYLKFMYGGKGKDDSYITEYVEKLREIIEQNPNYADARNNLGVAYLIQCRNLFLKALEEFRKALKINQNYKKADKNLKLAENDGKGFLILLRAILK